MVTICQKCGDEGFSVALIYCDKCQVYAEHRYCLDKLPATFEEYVTWYCEDCLPEVAKPTYDKPSPVPSRGDRLESRTQSRKRPEDKREDRVVLKKIPIKKKVLKKRFTTRSVTRTKVQKHGGSPSTKPSENRKRDQKLEKQRKPISKDKGNTDKDVECSTIQKDLKRSVTRTEVQKHGGSPSAKPIENHERYQKLEKQMKHISKDKGNTDKDVECSMIRKDLKRSVSRTGVQKRGGSPSTQPEENHERDHKLGKRRKLILTDKDNNDKDVESSKIHIDEKLEEVESSKVSSDQKLEEAESSKISLSQKFDKAESNKINNDQKLEKRRSLVRNYKGNSDEEAESSKITFLKAAGNPFGNEKHNGNVSAQPVIDPVWRGRFSICNKRHSDLSGLAAHVSSKACWKVCAEARLFPESLRLDILPRSNVWPKSFESSGPTDDHIGLYFFPGHGSLYKDELDFDMLVEYMIEEDRAMRAEVSNAELLVFTSMQLPVKNWRFQAKFYLWGVFRRKQSSLSPQANGYHCSSNEGSVFSDGNGEERNLRKTVAWDRRSPVSPLCNTARYATRT